MLKNASYIYDNVIKADGVNTTKEYCKKAQVGVDLTIKSVEKFKNAGKTLKDKTYASKTTTIKPKKYVFKDMEPGNQIHIGYKLKKGSYIVVLNEGCDFGPKDTGYIILRSSLNRSGVSIQSAVWDPGYKSVDGDVIYPMSIRMTVDNKHGFFIEQNARIAQLLVAENDPTKMYDGQWQGGKRVSKLV